MDNFLYFEDKKVRFVGNWENPEWIAQDICDILEIINVSDALSDFDEEEKGIATVYTLGGKQNLLTVKEPGLYKLLFRSRKPIAERFTGWITKEVLPSIRKTGRYSLKQQSQTYWYDRMKIAMSSKSRPLASGYFSVYLRMMDFFSQLEVQLGYTLPDINIDTDEHIVPDISIGQGFNKFLRSEEQKDKDVRKDFLGSEDVVDFRSGGKNNSELEYYEHIYPKASHGVNNKHKVYAYPIKYSSVFDYYLENIWIPERFPVYIQERDEVGFDFIKLRIQELKPVERIVLGTTTLKGIIQYLLPPSE